MLFKRYTWSWDPQRVDINNLIDAQSSTDNLLAQVAQRFELLESTVERLEAMVVCQQRLLVEAGALDAAKLDGLVADELAKRHPPLPASHARPGDSPSLLRCIRCKRDVPANRTVMTGDGPMCDPGCAP